MQTADKMKIEGCCWETMISSTGCMYSRSIEGRVKRLKLDLPCQSLMEDRITIVVSLDASTCFASGPQVGTYPSERVLPRASNEISLRVL